MPLREICLLSDDHQGYLRKKCLSVELFNEQVAGLLQDMLDTLHNTDNGVALAAPQVGVLLRAVVIDLGSKPICLINPEIVEQYGRQEVTEGCLSIPGVWGKVRRPKIVKVKAYNEKGREIMIRGEGTLAKCLCHEIDHLDGILFIDKLIDP